MEGRRVGRYLIGQELASGGMATVHLGRMQGPAGFGKTIAIKRLHAQFAKDSDFAKMFLDEARVTSGLMHPNIVMTLDVLDEADDGLYLVMEYVHGASLAMIQRELPRATKFPIRVISAIVSGFLEGLQAAHEATDDSGEPLGVVHRDVSPQNVLVSFSGITKIADFGIAKAAGRMHSTGDGSAKGKLSYMAPEQVNTQPVTPRTDVFAAGIVLWECLTREKLVAGTSAAERLRALLELDPAPPSSIVPGIPPEVDAIVMRALEKDPAKRFASAKEMAAELQRAVSPASSIEVAEWVRDAVPELVREREAALTQLQRSIAVATKGGGFAPTPLPSGSSPSMDGTPPSERRTGQSQGETSAGNVAINDYLTQSEKEALPPRMPRRILALFIALPAAGILGVVLVLLTFMQSRSPVPGTAPPPPPPASVAATAQPVPDNSALANAPTPAAPSTGSVDIDESAPAASASASTPSVSARPKTAPAVAPAKTATAGKKCRIVAKPDSSGRMRFEEVCTP